MELIIFTGVQASGKSTFFQEYFSDSHVRINLDMLRTRHREKLIYNACLCAKQKVVVDNTNPRAEDRFRYIPTAKAAGFRIIGYYFQSKKDACSKRNEGRKPGRVVAMQGLLSTYSKLEIPKIAEGFDELHYVKIDRNNNFVIEEWTDEV